MKVQTCQQGNKIPYSPKTELHLKDVQISKAKNNLSTKLNATERRTINLKNPTRDIRNG